MRNPADWLDANSEFDAALEMSGPARELWLASLRVRDPARWEQFRTLLAEHDALDAAGFLNRSPQLFASGLSDVSLASRTAALVGQTFGAYTLSSPIGQGGMGTVWLARRSDGRFEGRAAVKLLNASLVGRAGEERFRREGTILARLTHPSIARLIDAGVSPSGQPYLVLEYVEGQHIDRYCDERALDVEARIRLFLDVLTAVAHAHANLVVHRDIKPSNVLVPTTPTSAARRRTSGRARQAAGFRDRQAARTEPDATGGHAAQSPSTRDSGWALTPEYAAPEQLTGQRGHDRDRRLFTRRAALSAA